MFSMRSVNALPDHESSMRAGPQARKNAGTAPARRFDLEDA
jgi:hypothetical protein